MDFYTENNRTEINILHLLKEVIDPELGINIVDLGLIYKVNYLPSPKQIQVNMTLSSKGCPMGDMILSQIHNLLSKHYSDYSIELNLIWEPAWSSDFITPAGKMELSIR